ncbi:phage tail protein [Desulfosediminicola sp.]|uniref:phage tail-collar fiber domain-containing protein n=1 Tax=Desulfosediminicola sp. TaxID=2886825 RepID=UPI003AF2A18B
MSAIFTNAGQTRINELMGLEQTLVINQMVFAYIPGLDPAAAIDRAQGMPDAGNIVHTEPIDPAHKGYVSPDQVVYSVILGSDVGDWSFNWIGLVEEGTGTVIAITTMPDTPKRKSDAATNTTGNNITRNFMIQFADAQSVTGITVAAETWQFNWMAEWNSHASLVVDPTQDGGAGKHVTDTQAKKWEDHANSPHDFVPASHTNDVVDPSKTGTTGKHVTDTQAKKWEDHANSDHAFLPIDGNASGSVLATGEQAKDATINNKLLTPQTGRELVEHVISNKPSYTEFTSSGNYTVPDDVFVVFIEVQGTGGSGGINDRAAGTQAGETKWNNGQLKATGGVGGSETSGGAGGAGSGYNSVMGLFTQDGEKGANRVLPNSGAGGKGGPRSSGGASVSANKTNGKDGVKGGGGSGGAYNTGDRGSGGGGGGFASGFVRVTPGASIGIVIGARGTINNYSGYRGGYGGIGYVRVYPFI